METTKENFRKINGEIIKDIEEVGILIKGKSVRDNKEMYTKKSKTKKATEKEAVLDAI